MLQLPGLPEKDIIENAEHWQRVDIAVNKLTAQYGEDFHAFLYRPDTNEFIQNEVLPFLFSCPNTHLTFLRRNRWKDKHPFNIPGPFYTGMSDTFRTGFREAPDNILHDKYSQEFLYRQPDSYVAFVCVLDAAEAEASDSYSCNGNSYWTWEKCKEWWSKHYSQIKQLHTPEVVSLNGIDNINRYIDYLTTTAETDLRRYCYFLENGIYPEAGALLPDL